MERDSSSRGPSRLLAVAAFSLIVLMPSNWAAGESGAEGSGQTTSDVHQFLTRGVHSVAVPPGVRGMLLEAVGGRGAERGAVAGGRPARVEGRIEVSPGTVIHAVVAGDAIGPEGGYNGGGDGAATAPNDPRAGGGGGGASDVRTIAPGQEGSLASRIAVAAGGGGAGATAGSGRLGGAGGNAGVGGGKAASGGPGDTLGAGGAGGSPGEQSVGGQGGQGGFSYSVGETGGFGSQGQLGVAGSGGASPQATVAGSGGGAGGGLYGGGGGGGGGTIQTPVGSTGGGGGGGGSFMVPPGGTWEMAQLTLPPSITLAYTIPEAPAPG